LLDSDYFEWFTEAKETFRSIPSTVIASVILQSFEELRKIGLEVNRKALFDVLSAVSSGIIAKEAIFDVLKESLSGSIDVQSAIKKKGLSGISQEELRIIVESVLREMLKENIPKEKMYGIMMGRVMKLVRGRIDGKIVDSEVKRQIDVILNKNG